MVLRTLAPEQLTVPQLCPLFGPASNLPLPDGTVVPTDDRDREASVSASIPPEDGQNRHANATEAHHTVPMPVMLPLDVLSALGSGSAQGSRSGLLSIMKTPASASSGITTAIVGKKRLKHWMITRNSTGRSRTKDTDENDDSTLPSLSRPPKRQRFSEASDYGSLALLMGTLARDSEKTANEMESSYRTDEMFFKELRQSLSLGTHGLNSTPRVNEGGGGTQRNSYSIDVSSLEHVTRDALDAEEYVREVVYGGVDGYAYIRSIAEFVSTSDSDNVGGFLFAVTFVFVY